MRLGTFVHHHGKSVPALVAGDRALDLERAFREERGLTDRIPDLGALLRHPIVGEDPRAAIDAVAAPALARADDETRRTGGTSTLAPLVASGKLRAPIPRPPMIWAVGLNYREHAAEQSKAPPAEPMIFTKAPSAVIGPGEAIVIPRGREQIDAEVELAVVIGRRIAAPIGEEDALAHIMGYTILNDVSDRAAQKSDKQYHRAKSWRTFAPMGPAVVTPDELAAAGAGRGTPARPEVAVCQRKSGEVWQRGRTSDLIFAVPRLVAWIASFADLEPGSIISTGTPSGVGVFRDPPVFLVPGDVVACEVEGIGVLENPVSAAPDATTR